MELNCFISLSYDVYNVFSLRIIFIYGKFRNLKDVKNTTKTTTTCYTTLDVGENATVKSEEFTLQGLCSTDGDDMVERYRTI